ncbi:MAG: ASKHA domain-containing protein [Oscillospiraceae bacterium]|nr:ASKHA domain-containing protein [Oscillospiraceae bacterium]
MANKIIFSCGGFNQTLDFDGKHTIFELLSKLSESGGIKTHFPCGGKGTCKKCKVTVKSGLENISALCDTEKQFLSSDEIEKNIRFACMCEVFGDAAIELKQEQILHKNKMQIQTEGLKSKNMIPDRLKKVTIQLEKSTLENPVPDDKNLKNALEVSSVSLDIIQKLTALKDNEIDVIINADNIIDIHNPGECEDIYGAAVDIGTTTVAVYLYSMTSGELVGIASAENPQRTYGADVISRINYIIENQNGLNILQNSILSLILKLINDLCADNDIPQRNIYNLVFTGNTVMQHITAGLSPKNIAFTPFTAATLFDFNIKINEFLPLNSLNISIPENAVIYFPPAFASYVGGDIAAGIIASDTDLQDKTRLFLDIGTNGEIGFGNKNGLVFCATAAGPAFEGAHIKFGMTGIKGAINKVYLNKSDENENNKNKIVYETIGGDEPKGICGSGIIDAVALMLDIGILDETGRIVDADEAEENGVLSEFIENLDEIDNDNVFIIDKKYNIYITQKDIREIQLAKAAVCAGIMTLLHHREKALADIDEVILAGGFGAHIDKRSACRIGLIPKELEEKIIIAGNTAGMGAAAVLLDSEARERIRKLPGISKYIELSGDSFLMDEYVDKMMF